MNIYRALGREGMRGEVVEVINKAIKGVQAELKHYRATHDFLDHRNNHDLTPYQCSAKVKVLRQILKTIKERRTS